MKTVITLLSASALLASFAFADSTNSSGVKTTQQSMQQEREQIQNENQNRFRNMSTDELLEKRGSLHNQQEREQLHNELQSRYQTMTQSQKKRFMDRPGNKSKVQNQQMMNNGMGGMGNGMGGMGGNKGSGGGR